MDGYRAWKIHRAVSFHLTTQKYDLFEYKGRTKNSTEEFYAKVNDRKFFELIGKNFDQPNDVVQFFVSNILYTGKPSIHDFSTCWDNYILWKKRRDGMTKFLSDDIERFVLPTDVLDGNPPKLLKELLSGRIMPETAIAINRYIPFSKIWIERNYFGSGQLSIIIDKADRFLGPFNKDKIEKLIREHEAIH